MASLEETEPHCSRTLAEQRKVHPHFLWLRSGPFHSSNQRQDCVGAPISQRTVELCVTRHGVSVSRLIRRNGKVVYLVTDLVGGT